MTPSHADAIADAILTPDPARVRVAARQREEVLQQQRRRVAAGASLAGMAAGVLIAQLTAVPWSTGMLYGGTVTFFVTTLWLGRRARRQPRH